MWHGLENVGWGWIWMGLLHVALFWGLCILVLVWLIAGGPPRGLGAMEILKARYAKGEITGEEFERMKRKLGEQDN